MNELRWILVDSDVESSRYSEENQRMFNTFLIYYRDIPLELQEVQRHLKQWKFMLAYLSYKKSTKNTFWSYKTLLNIIPSKSVYEIHNQIQNQLCVA